MKIKWYEILILCLTGVCFLVFLCTYFATTQAPGIWIATEYSRKADDSVSKEEKGRNDIQVNINTADKSELETLPGIGSAKAEAILNYRRSNGPFQSVDQLLEVDGIGEKLLDQLRAYVTVSDEK